MEREFRITVIETKKYGEIVGTHQRHCEIGNRAPQHVLGEMLSDVIVAMAPDDAANVLHALIHRMAVLGDESLRPFGKLASLWRIWQMRGGDAEFCEFVTVEEDYE
jgi:hypothetical protein